MNTGGGGPPCFPFQRVTFTSKGDMNDILLSQPPPHYITLLYIVLPIYFRGYTPCIHGFPRETPPIYYPLQTPGRKGIRRAVSLFISIVP
jgi:hypothetical protein